MKNEEANPCSTEESKWEKLDDEIRKKILDSRQVILAGEIGLSLVKEITRELLYLSTINQEPIKVILNSVGGEVYAGLLLYNTIRSIDRQGIKVSIEVRGLAASMGAIILQAASEGQRIAPKATRFLIHEVSSWSWGKVSEMEEQVEEIRKVNNMMRDIISERSGKSREEIDKLWTKKEVWYSADEARKWGLIDQVI